MSVFTKFLKLIKPQNHEYYNVEHFNHNSELIDKKMEEHDTALTTIQRGATNEQKGIVQFGIEEGKALEGNMLARLAGAYGFGGDIQTPGVKNQNYIYYDNNTRKMYKCLNQNSDTSANVQNYVPIDNFSFLERLENLSKLKGTYDSKNNKFKATIFIMSNMVFIHIYSHENSMSKLETDEIDLKVILNKELELSYGSLTGNSGTVGTMSVLKNTLKITATSENGLKNSFYGSIFTIFK